MHRSKQLATGFLLGALIVGGAIGFTADRMLLRDRLAAPWTVTRQALRDRLASDLHLTAEQRQQIDAILDSKHRQIDSLHRPLRAQLEAIGDTARAQMRRVLDDRQRAVFDRLHQEMVERRKRDTVR
ncbi:MAG: hypothetical protein NVS9B3_05290 [Gemmatimonadaceae bacterium]